MKETEKSTIKIGDEIIAVKDAHITDDLFVRTGKIYKLYDTAGSVPILQNEEGKIFAFVEKGIGEHFMKIEKDTWENPMCFKKNDVLRPIEGSSIPVNRSYGVTDVFDKTVTLAYYVNSDTAKYTEKYILPTKTVYKYFVKVSDIDGIETKPEVNDFENECMDCDGCAFFDECFEEMGDGDMVDYILAEANYQILQPFEDCVIVACKLPNGFVITESINCTNADENCNPRVYVETCLDKIEAKVREFEEYRALQNLWEFERFNQSCDSDCDDCEGCCGYCGGVEDCEKYE